MNVFAASVEAGEEPHSDTDDHRTIENIDCDVAQTGVDRTV